ncbi:fungal-specific transcription factor domain-containing protein [Nemania abortiva]|nr:fungal-specific transcription factor domain-containing protein [Nemania abortiva]
MQSDTDGLPHLRERVAQACDTCKQRKVKCDGQAPCSYCKRRHKAQTCHFSPAVRRRRRRSEQPTRISTRNSPSPSVVADPSSHIRPIPATRTPTPTAPTPADSVPTAHASPTLTRHSDVSAEEEAEVPRDARLICDAQGRLAFIGDCAPLSLFQTVRQIVTSRVDPHAFVPETNRISMLENIISDGVVSLGPTEEPSISQSGVHKLVATFLTVVSLSSYSNYTYATNPSQSDIPKTSGLVDLFDTATLVPEIQSWASQTARPVDVTSAVHYLVLAIGSQCEDEQTATAYFLRGKHLTLSALSGNLSIGTVQAFILTTLYMLRSCQINAAYLFFGIAARAAYSIGLHRTEVNSRFGPEIHTRRDRLWKSVRVLDLYLSISMGRPPAAADSDCSVSYHSLSPDGSERYDLLNASAQILSLVERIIWQVYSRRKISLQLTEGISRELRCWSRRWLAPLLRAAEGCDERNDEEENERERERTGACQVLSSYYYGVMLISRPFLMYELCKRLSEPSTARLVETNGSGSGRAKLANACIDAATLMIGLISDFVERRPADRRMPLIVSWLFTSSLVVGVGLIGDFSRSLDKALSTSISSLEYLAQHDTHAAQYARIATSLRACATTHLEQRDAAERRRVAEDSTQLFGLLPSTQTQSDSHPTEGDTTAGGSCNGGGCKQAETRAHDGPDPGPEEPIQQWTGAGPFEDFDPAIFSFDTTPTMAFRPPLQGDVHVYVHDGADQVFGAINMFPLPDGNGHIDLAHLM